MMTFHIREIFSPGLEPSFKKPVFRKIMKQQQQQSLQGLIEERGDDIISPARDTGKNK